MSVNLERNALIPQVDKDVIIDIGSDEDECVICLFPMVDSDSVPIHRSDRIIHRLHEACFIELLKTYKNCPICRAPLDDSSIIPLRSKCIKTLKWSAVTLGVIVATLGYMRI
jgi:hypothetical protein